MGLNDGVENEKQLVDVLNGKCFGRLNGYLQQFISQMFGTVADQDIVTAKKIGGQGYKPDLEINVLGKSHYVSVKKGGGNSVHQEKTELFLLYCIHELGMSINERDSLLLFLYGDGTLDGNSLPQERLSDIDLLQRYKKEIETVQKFLDNNKRKLLERFLVFGRKGEDNGIKAEYIYHGNAEYGVWCPLDYESIDYLVSLPNSDNAPLSIGPFTLQVWNRNPEGKTNLEERRHSIQIKWASCKKNVEEINKHFLTSRINSIEKSKRTRVIGNNNQGFENQDNLISIIDGSRVNELPIAVKQLVTRVFPYVALSEKLHAGKVTEKDVKPRMYIEANKEKKYLTVFMGCGNSVHQEKIGSFLDYCEKELHMSESIRNDFLTIMYGDGTIDGNSEIKDRLKNTEEVKARYPIQTQNVQSFFDQNKKILIERFLIYGKGGKQKNISTDFVYYGTAATGRVSSQNTIIEYLVKKEGAENALLSLGSLTTQPWNRNPEGKINLEERRHSLQIKWGGIKQDLSHICDKYEKSQTGTYDGDWEEYELVGRLNREKKTNNRLWITLCSELDINNIDDIYAVRVSSFVYSKISDRQVLPKADVYLVKGIIPHELLLDNNYWLDEHTIQMYNLKFIPCSGISCKKPSSTGYTYSKFTIKSFIALFAERSLGAAISMFVMQNELCHNYDVFRAWGVEEKDLIEKYAKDMEHGKNTGALTENEEICKLIKGRAIEEMRKRIIEDSQIAKAIFWGKGIFEEPYTASFLYARGEIIKNIIPKFTITTGSGRHKGNYTIIVKP